MQFRRLVAVAVVVVFVAPFALCQRLRLVPQTGHALGVASVAYSPKGHIVASGGADGAVKIWDISTGTVLRTLAGHTSLVQSVAFSPDGLMLASASDDKSVCLWDVATGRIVTTLLGHTKGVEAVAFSPDGRTLASGSQDGTTRLWNVKTGKPIRTLSGYGESVFSVAFAPGGHTLACGGGGGAVRIWEILAGSLLQTLTDHSDAVFSLAFSPNGRTIASGGWEKRVHICDVATGKVLHSLAGHTGKVSSLAFSPDGHMLATDGWNGAVRFWDAATGKILHNTVADKSVAVWSIAFSPDGHTLIGGISDHSIRFWNAANGSRVRIFDGHTSVVHAVAFSPDGRILATGNSDNSIHMWDLLTGKAGRTLSGHTSVVYAAAFAPDGHTLASASADGDVRLWDVATGKFLHKFSGHKNGGNKMGILSVAFSPDGRRLASGGFDQVVRIWDVATAKRVGTYSDSRTTIWSVAFSPDGNYLAAGCGQMVDVGALDSYVYLWDTRTDTLINTLYGHSGAVLSVAFSSDETRLASGSWDRTIRLWGLSTGKTMSTLADYKNAVASVVFSPNDSIVASASYDSTIGLSGPGTNKTLFGHAGPALSVAFAPHGQIIASGGADGTVRLWDSVNGRELCTLISFHDGGWAVSDSDGRFDSSDGGNVDGLDWVYDDSKHHRMEPIDLNQFKRDYYEPGLLAKVMGFNKDPVRKVKPLDEIDIKLTPEITVTLHDNKAGVTLTDRGGGIGPTDVSLEGAHIWTEPRPKGQVQTYRFVTDLSRFTGKLTPGLESQLSVVAHTYDVSARPDRPDYLASRAIKIKVAQKSKVVATVPRIFLLACGSSDYAGARLNLRYAAKDAIDLARELTHAAQTFVGKDKVFTTLLASDVEHPELKPPTRKHLIAALAEIKAKAKSTDIVVVYLSGHGVAAGTGDQDYYYVCSNADDATPGTALFRDVTLSGRAIADSLASMNAAKKIVILDTCASGAFGKREVGSDMRRAWEDMKDRSGTYVLAGCAADAVSYESSCYNQGLLTYSLIEAMKANDDVWTPDHYLDAQKWLSSTERSVQRLVDEAQIEGIQRPEFKAGKDSRDFYVGKLSSDDRKAITLASPLPILLPVGNVRDEDDPSEEDTLGLRAKVNDLLISRSARGRGQGYALWRTDAQPGAFRFNVRYKKGQEISATVSLLQFPKDPKARPEPVATFSVTAKADKLSEAILAEVVKRVGG